MGREMSWYLGRLTLVAACCWALLWLCGVGAERPTRLLLALLLLALSVVAYQFPVRLRPDWKVHVANCPLLAAAFLLPAAEAMGLAFLAALLGNAFNEAVPARLQVDGTRSSGCPHGI